MVLALALGACGTWDPTNQFGADDEPATADAGSATAELTVGEQRFSFQMDECFASPGDGIEVRASTAGGRELHIDYSADAPRERTLQVVEDGEIVFDGNPTEGLEDPDLDIEEDAFTGTATFRSTDGSEVNGEMSGAC